jgi:hypothetical protein
MCHILVGERGFREDLYPGCWLGDINCQGDLGSGTHKIPLRPYWSVMRDLQTVGGRQKSRDAKKGEQV